MVGYLICSDCGQKYGTPRGLYATWYPGTCDYCKQEKIVTEARDYCYPNLPEDVDDQNTKSVQ